MKDEQAPLIVTRRAQPRPFTWRCINCYEKTQITHWFGEDVGPFCEECYQHVLTHVAPKPEGSHVDG